MVAFRPKYITFDCYGTLTRTGTDDMTRAIYLERVGVDHIGEFYRIFNIYRMDEVLGAWKPYKDILCNALERTCKRWGIPFDEEEGLRFYEAVPDAGPHSDVPEPLARVANDFPLVILSNAANAQIQDNVEKLGAPFHAVYTAEQAQAYKPRLQAFEYMFEELGCAPEDVMHVSASMRYDMMAAHDIGIQAKVFVKRGYEQPNHQFGLLEIDDIGGLPADLGL